MTTIRECTTWVKREPSVEIAPRDWIETLAQKWERIADRWDAANHQDPRMKYAAEIYREVAADLRAYQPK